MPSYNVCPTTHASVVSLVLKPHINHINKKIAQLQMQLTLLEVKLGVIQLAASLSFLHNDASLTHLGISPEVCSLPGVCNLILGLSLTYLMSQPMLVSYFELFPCLHYQHLWRTSASEVCSCLLCTFLPWRTPLTYFAAHILHSATYPTA